MAHKKGAGSTDNGRDSKPKYLGVKLFGGQAATAGNILVRQRGTKFHPGDNVYMGKDYTLHAKVDGTVVYRRRKDDRTYVSIRPLDEAIASNTRSIIGTSEARAAASSTTASASAPAKSAAKPAKATAPKKEAKVAAPVKETKAAAPEKEAKASASKAKAADSAGERDDLKKIEGVGPKIEQLLNEGGFMTFADVAKAPVEKIQAILDEAGPRYRIHDPATWTRQAQLAADGKWDELQQLQDELDGGRE